MHGNKLSRWSCVCAKSPKQIISSHKQEQIVNLKDDCFLPEQITINIPQTAESEASLSLVFHGWTVPRENRWLFPATSHKVWWLCMQNVKLPTLSLISFSLCLVKQRVHHWFSTACTLWEISNRLKVLQKKKERSVFLTDDHSVLLHKVALFSSSRILPAAPREAN